MLSACSSARVDQRALQRLEPGIGLVDRVAHPQAEVGRHLVVAAARGVQAPGHRADQLGEAALDGHVDVLERPVLGHAVALVLGGDLVEPVLDRLRILGRNHPAGAEHRGVRLARGDVLPPQRLVERDRGVNLAHDRARPFGEAPAPHPVGARHAPIVPRFAHVRARPRCWRGAIGKAAKPRNRKRRRTRAASWRGTIDRSFAGQALPAVELTDPAGATLATADLKGTPVLLNLWATWCVPCVTEMPMLDELAGELGDSVRVVTVSQDMNGAEAVGPFFAQRKFAHLPQWLDPEERARGRLRRRRRAAADGAVRRRGQGSVARRRRLRLVDRRGARGDRRGDQDVTSQLELDRRRMLGGLALGLGGAALAACGGRAGAQAAAACSATPTETRGPFPADGSNGRPRPHQRAGHGRRDPRRDIRASFAGMPGPRRGRAARARS